MCHGGGTLMPPIITARYHCVGLGRSVECDPGTPGKVWLVGASRPAKSTGDQPSDMCALIEVGQP